MVSPLFMVWLIIAYLWFIWGFHLSWRFLIIFKVNFLFWIQISETRLLYPIISANSFYFQVLSWCSESLCFSQNFLRIFLATTFIPNIFGKGTNKLPKRQLFFDGGIWNVIFSVMVNTSTTDKRSYDFSFLNIINLLKIYIWMGLKLIFANHHQFDEFQ